MDYYILSLKNTDPEALVWWRPNNAGYTIFLDMAGKYSVGEVFGNKSYYDNGKDTMALPCHIVDEFVAKIVPSNSLTKIKRGLNV